MDAKGREERLDEIEELKIITRWYIFSSLTRWYAVLYYLGGAHFSLCRCKWTRKKREHALSYVSTLYKFDISNKNQNTRVMVAAAATAMGRDVAMAMAVLVVQSNSTFQCWWTSLDVHIHMHAAHADMRILSMALYLWTRKCMEGKRNGGGVSGKMEGAWMASNEKNKQTNSFERCGKWREKQEQERDEAPATHIHSRTNKVAVAWYVFVYIETLFQRDTQNNQHMTIVWPLDWFSHGSQCQRQYTMQNARGFQHYVHYLRINCGLYPNYSFEPSHLRFSCVWVNFLKNFSLASDYEQFGINKLYEQYSFAYAPARMPRQNDSSRESPW